MKNKDFYVALPVVTLMIATAPLLVVANPTP
jgi:hypothetical protein